MALRHTLQRLNPDLPLFMSRIINPSPPFLPNGAPRETMPPSETLKQSYPHRQRETSPDPDLSELDDESTEIESESESERDAKKRITRRRQAPTKATSTSIGVMCDAYVQESDVPGAPRFIIENLKAETTHRKGNTNVKYLYDALHLLSKGETERFVFDVAAKRRGNPILKAAVDLYTKNVQIPMIDFYILTERATDPLKTIFLKITSPFLRAGGRPFLLPRSLLHKLGETFDLANGSNTKMTFTDVATGSPGGGYKFNLPTYADDFPAEQRVTYAFMVELTDARLRGSITLPTIESSAPGHNPAPAPSAPSAPSAPPAPSASSPPPAAGAAPPAPSAPSAPSAPPALPSVVQSISRTHIPSAKPSRAAPPTPIEKGNFWGLSAVG